ncbi:MAG TPA: YetF domain-containing protein [Aurantimonas sp.]|jgi:uncharacterized membrane protein YcaP (DUF421 family)|nr:YetF domain-containing protein [Aurantimonas sp.]
MFFDNWYGLLRVLVVGILAYSGLVFMLRVTGKRTLSKMNAFDLIVTVALGSTLATVLLTSSVALAEGLLAFALLCGLQYVVAMASVRSERFQSIIKAQPSLLFHNGRFIGPMLRKERVTEEEILAAVRSQGHADMEKVSAVVLETDGSFSVLTGSGSSGSSALRTVKGGSETA